MVVIVIIGILAVVGLTAFQNALKRSRDTKRIGDLKDIAAAQEQQNSLQGSYVVGASATTCPAAITAENQFPSDPQSVSYACNITTSAFCVAAALERGGGNCGGCSGAGTMITGATTHFCVIDKQ